MKDLISYIDDLKEKCGSDYKAAKMLGISKVTVSKLRTRKQLSDDLALKIADILNIEPEELLIAAAVARSDGRVRAAWEKTAQRITAAALIILTTGCTHYDSIKAADLSDNIHYAKFKRMMTILTRLFDFRKKVYETRKKKEINVLSHTFQHRGPERRKSFRSAWGYY